MVTDVCPIKGNEKWCSGDMDHFDVTSPTFPLLADKSLGITNITMRKVVCDIPATSPVKVYLNEYMQNQYWLSLLVFNHKIGVSKVQVQSSGSSTWISLERKPYNYWEFSSDFKFPLKVRITSIHNTVVEGSISDLSKIGKVVEMQKQFDVDSSKIVGATATATPKPTATATPKPTAKPTATPKPTAKKTATPKPTAKKTATPKPTAKPTTTPTPKPTATPAQTKSYNYIIQNGQLQGKWERYEWWGCTPTFGYSMASPVNKNSLKVALVPWAGLKVGSPVQYKRDSFTQLSFYIKSTSAHKLQIWGGENGGNAYQFTPTKDQWTLITIKDLKNHGFLDTFSSITIQNTDQDSTFYIDDFKFELAAAQNSVANEAEKPASSNKNLTAIIVIPIVGVALIIIVVIGVMLYRKHKTGLRYVNV